MKIGPTIATWPLSVIYLKSRVHGSEVVQAGAFVFDVPDGFAFMHPAYLDPWNAMQRFHRVEAVLLDVEVQGLPGFAFQGVEWGGHIERYVSSEAQDARVGGDFAEFPQVLLRDTGRSMAEERARLLVQLAEDLR